MQRFPIYLMCGALAALLLSRCDVREILPNDLSDPTHARYVASGDKDKDRQQFHTYLLICDELWTPILEDQFAQCILDPDMTESGCRIGLLKFPLILNCAAGLVDYHSGARRYEFFDPNRF
jgi:hypothetical protein